jgi:NAD(P)-dependent dehydrogenase (short-subunit alcohol dehydrogenase family)
MRTVLDGRVALVTGGGRGLGEQICRVLAAEGAVVLVADVREDDAKRVAAEIGANGGTAGPLVVDLRQELDVVEGMRSVVAEHGRLDVLVNNAGVDLTVPVEELSVADFDRIVAVNLRAPFITCREALKHMRRRGVGHIVNIASTAAKRAWPNASAYHASKWGLLGLSHAIHTEARPYNIKVTAVVAGGMRTPFIFDRFPDADPNLLQDPANVAETVRFVLTQPAETVIPEIMVLPLRETSWP